MASGLAVAEIEDPALLSSQTASLLPGSSAVGVGRTKCLVAALASATLGAVVGFATRGSSAAAGDFCLTRSCVRAAALLMDSIDAAAPPCDDFYAHSCGKWATANPMPADSSSYSTFAVLSERNDAALRSMLEREEAGDRTLPTDLARAYYAACMDIETIEQLGARPLAPLLQDLSWSPASEGWAISDWEELSARLGRLQRRGTMPLFYWWAMADESNSTANVVHVGQVGAAGPK
jgi:predicted metalloendopeptidase